MFPPTLFRFLRDLAKNNDTVWFQENRDRYVEHVRTPCLDFIEAVAGSVKRISPHLQAVAKPAGGSLLLPNRDRRFARDLPPYKGFAGIHFRHEEARLRRATPGFYLHLEPSRVYLAAGVRQPDGAASKAIRARILEDPANARRALRARTFREFFVLNGERRSRPPPDVEPDHPLRDVLLLKDFSAVAKLTQRDVCGPTFPDDAVALMRGAVQWVRLLCEALDLEF